MRNELTELEVIEIAQNIEKRYADISDADWYRIVEVLVSRANV